MLVVSKDFLAANPTVVSDLLKGQVATTAFLKSSPAKAQADANTALAAITGKALKAPELATAWSDMTFTNDPIASSIATDLVHAKAAGFTTSNISGIYRPRSAQPAAGEPRESHGGDVVTTLAAHSSERAPSPGPVGDPRAGCPSATAAVRPGGGPPGHLPRRRAPASSSAWSVPRGAARPPCSTWWPASTGPPWGRWTSPSVIRAGPPSRPGTRPGGGTGTAMLFQDSALFPWLTVAANVELPLRLRGVGKAERRAVADDLLERVHLGRLRTKRPHELSGGMRQRAALARALAQDAGLLLMDEPFGALDAITRDLLHDELESLWADRGFTVLFVTHNVREAARLGDRIVLLTSRPGRVAATYPVDLARPRRIDSPEIAGLAATVTDQLRAEVGRHGR